MEGLSLDVRATVLEVEARPRASILDRLLEYLCRVFRRLRHGPRRRDRYQVAAVLLVLTGRQRPLAIDMTLPGTDARLSWSCRVCNLSRLPAAATLERIGRGELGRGILPWIPLLKGGGEPAVAAQWGQLVQAEPNLDHRRDWAGLAGVFADRVGHWGTWRPILEGVDMWESETLKEARNRGRLLEKRNVLREILQARFLTEPSQELIDLFERTTDLDTLSRWIKLAATAPSLDAFRAGLPPATN